MITSCLQCRRRKLGCDKRQPCGNCPKIQHECLYMSSQLHEASHVLLASLKEEFRPLHRQMEREVVQSNSAARTLAEEVDDDDGNGVAEPTDLEAAGIRYEEDGDMDDLIDLGVRVGRMRITERVGGLTMPRLSVEVSSSRDRIS